ncbi:MAG TPA: calcium-binding protein [Baekduia sp.]|nr:calcium-binding protein [Baekduia sp.]
MRRTLLAVPVVALLGVGLTLPATSVGGHEPTCATALSSGAYNVIHGAGAIVGTNGNDVIIGSAGADSVAAGNGDDVVCGLGGADSIDGGNGADLLLGDVCTGCGVDPGAPGADAVSGGNGNDRVWGDEGADVLTAGNGDDALFGGNPGGDGDETDACDGGRGTDTAARCDTVSQVP